MFPNAIDSMESTHFGGFIHKWLQKMRGRKHDPQANLGQNWRGPILDEVTGVYNQWHLVALLEHEKARSDAGQGVFCVGIVDIDHFGRVGEFHGRAASENVLRHVAAAIAVELRRVDMVGHYAGGKFVFALVQTRLDRAQILPERVRRRISSLEISGLRQPYKITASIGLAEYRRGEDIGVLMQRAESALPHAEANAGNCIDAS